MARSIQADWAMDAATPQIFGLEPFAVKDGYAHVSMKPGLGITPGPDKLAMCRTSFLG
ncbi:hypothetical protein [Roseovarius aestuarii]|uniref:hypothetical protein n=1 Tax=Roseovarius aestuarii TaxID=475083 RepID=UPI0015946747|nr:hypothetical protein [Roseovarius aestuarii]